jgi:hypothetical protein
MDQTNEQKVAAARQKQAAVAETIRAVQGEQYLEITFALAGILMLGRALAIVGHAETSRMLTQQALVNAFKAFGVEEDEQLTASLGKDALSLAEVSYVPAT